MVLIALSIIRWRRGQCLSLYFGGRQRGLTANPANPQRPQRQAVVRTDPEVGVPGYTRQASKGELSLGIGRKRSVEEEYELAETMSNPERREPEERRSRDRSKSQNTSANIQTSLPPYLPPPAPAVAMRGSITRPASRYSQSLRRVSNAGTIPVSSSQSHA